MNPIRRYLDIIEHPLMESQHSTRLETAIQLAAQKGISVVKALESLPSQTRKYKHKYEIVYYELTKAGGSKSASKVLAVNSKNAVEPTIAKLEHGGQHKVTEVRDADWYEQQEWRKDRDAAEQLDAAKA